MLYFKLFVGIVTMLVIVNVSECGFFEHNYADNTVRSNFLDIIRKIAKTKRALYEGGLRENCTEKSVDARDQDIAKAVVDTLTAYRRIKRKLSDVTTRGAVNILRKVLGWMTEKYGERAHEVEEYISPYVAPYAHGIEDKMDKSPFVIPYAPGILDKMDISPYAAPYAPATQEKMDKSAHMVPYSPETEDKYGIKEVQGPYNHPDNPYPQ